MIHMFVNIFLFQVLLIFEFQTTFSTMALNEKNPKIKLNCNFAYTNKFAYLFIIEILFKHKTKLMFKID